MNTLESEITKHGINNFTGTARHTFEHGCRFILEKNLDIKFVMWLNKMARLAQDEELPQEIKIIMLSHLDEEERTIALRNHWLNHIYGKK